VLLRYGHVENANTVAELLKTLMPHVNVHQATYTKDHDYKGMRNCSASFMRFIVSWQAKGWNYQSFLYTVRSLCLLADKLVCLTDTVVTDQNL
jgi:hypothetical protein